MRVLFVTTCYPDEKSPQHCIFLEQQAKALSGFCECVDVLFIDESGSESKEYIYNGVKIFRCPVKRANKYESLLFTTLSKNEEQSIGKIITGNYDIVSFHFGGSKIVRSIQKICKKSDIPFVLHFHGLNVFYEAKEKYKLLYAWYRVQKKIIYQKSDSVVGVSDKVIKRFKEKIKSVPTFVVYNGVDTERFIYRNRTDLNLPLKLLCVANLIDIKGQDLLIKAVDELKKSGTDCELTLVGGGPNEEALKDLVKTLNLCDSVEFTGVLNYDAVSKLMFEADIFVMPCYYEALGCVYLEAMASGLITVGVSGQGIDEIIKPGENGFLVPPKDTEAIVGVITEICGINSDRLSRISEAARQTALGFTWVDSAKALNEVYEKTVSRFREG